MTVTSDPLSDAPRRRSKLPILLGFALALAGGGGGYFAVSSGLLSFGESGEPGAADVASSSSVSEKRDPGETAEISNSAAFVALEPMVISIPSSGGTRFLRFAAQLDVEARYQSDVEAVKPRIVDVLNGYLRAVKLEEFEDPAILARLRGQMLRRVQVVTGREQVRDLLIMEFVLN